MMKMSPTSAFIMIHRLLRSTALCALALLPAGGAWAEAAWETIVRDRNRDVQIDRSSIIASDGGTKVAWGRIVLAPSEAAGRPYATVQALNRYDCVNRTFFTVRRRYLDARNFIVGEEDVADPRPLVVAANTVDERLWREVCRPPTVADLTRVADEAQRVAALLTAATPTPAARAAQTSSAAAPGPRAPAGETAPVVTRAAAVDHAAPRPVSPMQAPASTARPDPQSSSAPPRETIRAAVPQTAASADQQAAGSLAPSGARDGVAARASVVRTQPAQDFAASGAAGVEWSYAGATGPEHWGRLRPEWALCEQGQRQSPIDLRGGVAVDLEPVLFDYRPTRFRITDTGRTLKVQVGAGMGVEIRGQRYELEHFQLHRPSEERVGGRAFDMNVHFHHRDADGRMAIVAVLLEGGAEPHPLVQTLWNSLPLERGDHYMPALPIDLASLVPDSPAHYLYMGSLTTPPCTEGVVWVVMKEPVRVSDEQLGVFARLYPRNGRPIQPLHGRLILESR